MKLYSMCDILGIDFFKKSAQFLWDSSKLLHVSVVHSFILLSSVNVIFPFCSYHIEHAASDFSF